MSSPERAREVLARTGILPVLRAAGLTRAYRAGVARRQRPDLSRAARTSVEQRLERRLDELEGTTARQRDDLQVLRSRLRATAGASLSLMCGVRTADDDADEPTLISTLIAKDLTEDQSLATAELLIDAGHALTADLLLQRSGGGRHVAPVLMRAAAAQLRDRGYLERAIAWAGLLEGRTGRADHAEMARTWRAEADVLSGRFEPTLPHTPVDHQRSTVLHVVGPTLLHRQTGYTLRTAYSVAAQRRLGIDAQVVSQVGVQRGERPRVDSLWDTPHHRLGGRLRSKQLQTDWIQRNAEGVLRVVQAVRPAVLHAHSDYVNAMTARAVGSATGIPVVYEARGFWEETWLQRQSVRFGWGDPEALFETFGVPEAYSWRRQREAHERAAADRVVTLAETMATRVVAEGVPRDRVTVTPNAVASEAFRNGGRSAAVGESLGLADDDIVFGYVSSLVEYEGVEVLLEAFAELRESTEVPVRLLVVGDGACAGHLAALASRLGEDGITFTGKVPHEQVVDYLSAIDVFVVPRLPHEVCHLVTPLKPFEAFAAGCAVVMSDVDALREIEQDSGGAAALFKAGDPSSLAHVMHELVADPGRRAAMAEHGRRWVAAERSWDANARTLKALYSRLIAAQG